MFGHKKKSVLILWYPIGCNFGDYMLYQTVCGYLTEWGYEIADMDVGMPYSMIAKEARKHEWLWFAGGGIIERGIPDVIINFEKFHKKTGRIKYGITGLSIGGFQYDEHAKALTYWVENAQYFFTRDLYSACELNRIAGCNKVISSVDVVFAYQGIPKTNNDQHGTVGINLRDLPYTDLSGEFQWKKWEAVFKKCISERLIGIPDQFDYSKLINLEMQGGYSPENVLKTIMLSDYTVAMRYHVLLVAARMGILCIPIGYCPKVSRLAEQLGIEELELGVHDYAKLPEVIDKYKNNKLFYHEKVKNNVVLMENRAKEMFAQVRKIMEEKSHDR